MENILSQVSTSGKGLRNVFHYNLSTTKTKGLSEDVTDKTVDLHKAGKTINMYRPILSLPVNL